MRRKTAIVLGVSGAALALTASSAFTAGGLTLGTNATGFIGGNQTVTINGTTISNIEYTKNTAGTKLATVKLTFSDANAVGKTPTLNINNGGSATVDDFTCTAVATASSVTTSTCSAGSTDVLMADLVSVKINVG